MLQVRWSLEANEDFHGAREWYASIRPALGEEFASAVEVLLKEVSASPLRFAVVHRRKRRARLERFPYSLYFLLEAETIVVVACFHAKRDPRIWQHR